MANGLNHCSAGLLFYLCHYRDALLYLVPSVLLACFIYLLARLHPIFFALRLAGTMCHEAAHFLIGLLTGAEPRSFSIIPRRTDNGWQLGAVMLTNIRWYNAAPAALAPFLIILVPAMVALWRTQQGLNFRLTDAALALLLAPQFLSFWPSWTDWKIALHSWPYILPVGLFCWLGR